MNNKIKRASILMFIIYVMINALAWGFMKVYINSHNAVSHDKLAMAQVTDTDKGKKISVLGNSFYIPENNEADSRVNDALKMLIPSKIKIVSELFKQTGQKIALETSNRSTHNGNY